MHQHCPKERRPGPGCRGAKAAEVPQVRHEPSPITHNQLTLPSDSCAAVCAIDQMFQWAWGAVPGGVTGGWISDL